MAEITRRGLLGMFAAGAAASVLPSGVIMPVRKIIVPTGFWQDFGRTIPAHLGDPVAVADNMLFINGAAVALLAGNMDKRPCMVRHDDGTLGVSLNGSMGEWMKTAAPALRIQDPSPQGVYIGSRREAQPAYFTGDLYRVDVSAPSLQPGERQG